METTQTNIPEVTFEIVVPTEDKGEKENDEKEL